jgi:hypothetical protein
MYDYYNETPEAFYDAMRDRTEEHFKFMEAVRNKPEAREIRGKLHEISRKMNKLYFRELDKSYEHTNQTRRQFYAEKLVLDSEGAKLDLQLLNVIFPDPNQSVDHKKMAKETAEWLEEQVKDFKTKYPEFTPDYKLLYGTK